VLEADDALLGGAAPGVCAGCHSDGDSGFASAQAMRASLDKLKASIEQNAALIGRLRNSGMEVSDQELAINEARMHLTLARTEVHTFAPAAVDPVVNDGLAILDGVGQAGERALAELRFRRRGLAASLGAILLLVVAIALKIREIERRQRRSSEPI
jgi:hypothetical protein